MGLHHFPSDPAIVVVSLILGIQRDTLGIVQESTHRTLVMFLERASDVGCGTPPKNWRNDVRMGRKKQTNTPTNDYLWNIFRLG